MTTFRERTTHSVNYRISLFMYYIYVLVVSYLGFEERNLVLLRPVSDHCLPFTLNIYFEH